GKPFEYAALDWQSGAAAFAGQWSKAQEMSRHAISLGARTGRQEAAARYASERALRGALFGDCRQTGADGAQGVKLMRERITLSRAALANGLCGEANQARPLFEELSSLYPEDPLINELWLPSIRAALELQKGNATQAIQQLQMAAHYEAAAEFWPPY